MSIRVLDRGRFEIANSTRVTYYFDTFVWTEEQLECGRGLTDLHMQGGVLAPGASVEIPAGSRRDAPVTVSIWDAPCGLGCYRPPIGLFVVPESSMQPSPMPT